MTGPQSFSIRSVKRPIIENITVIFSAYLQWGDNFVHFTMNWSLYYVSSGAVYLDFYLKFHHDKILGNSQYRLTWFGWLIAHTSGRGGGFLTLYISGWICNHVRTECQCFGINSKNAMIPCDESQQYFENASNSSIPDMWTPTVGWCYPCITPHKNYYVKERTHLLSP